jgi:ABC-type multidrug transport system ATPase subunit
VQVAAALVSKPQTMILDEPTTGLDGSNALHLIKVLRRVCVATEMTALASLHQCRREIMSELDGMCRFYAVGTHIVQRPHSPAAQCCGSPN